MSHRPKFRPTSTVEDDLVLQDLERRLQELDAWGDEQRGAGVAALLESLPPRLRDEILRHRPE